MATNTIPKQLDSWGLMVSRSRPNSAFFPEIENDTKRMNLSSDERDLGNSSEPDLGNSDGSLKGARKETPVLKRPRQGSVPTLSKCASVKVFSLSFRRPSPPHRI